MNFLDLLVVLAATTAGWVGYRMGFVHRITSWAGLVGGVVLAVVLVDDVAELLRGSPPRTRLLGALAFVVLAATVGHALGYALGAAVTGRLGRHAPRAIRAGDRVAGAIVGVTGVLTLLWLLTPALASSPGWPARAVRDSAVARAIDRVAPAPPDEAMTLGRIVDDVNFPQVFDTLTSPDAGSPPTEGVGPAVARRVSRSVVLVDGLACDRVQEGTGFVVAPGLVVTNAHVVAGVERVAVTTGDGTRHATQPVAFDPDRDLAVLRVPQLARAPLERGTGHVDDRGSVFGHPAGGPLRESPMRIAQQIVARGTNIQRDSATEREVFVLAAVTEPGDSGAPVVRTDGVVVGVLFAFEPGQLATAYALTGSELDAVLADVSPTPVSTGPCLD